MDVREKLVALANDVLQYLPWGEIQKDTAERIADRMMDHGVTVQEWIPQAEFPWMGEEIAKLCIRYMEDYADFHGYASSKKVKAHIVRLLELEKEGRIAILPQPPKGE